MTVLHIASPFAVTLPQPDARAETTKDSPSTPQPRDEPAPDDAAALTTGSNVISARAVEPVTRAGTVPDFTAVTSTETASIAFDMVMKRYGELAEGGDQDA